MLYAHDNYVLQLLQLGYIQCYGYLVLTRHNNEPSEDDSRSQGVVELSRKGYITNDEIDSRRQRRSRDGIIYVGSRKCILQTMCTHNTHT